LDLYIEWIQALERFFEIKDYFDGKAFKVVVLKLKKYASLWCEYTKDYEPKKESHRSKLGPSSRN